MKIETGLAFSSTVHLVCMLAAWENSKAVHAFPDVQTNQNDGSQWFVVPREGSETVSHSEKKTKESAVTSYSSPRPEEEVLEEGQSREVWTPSPPLNEALQQQTIDHSHQDEEKNDINQHVTRTQRAQDKQPHRSATPMLYREEDKSRRPLSFPLHVKQRHRHRQSLSYSDFSSANLFSRQANTLRPGRFKFLAATLSSIAAATVLFLFLGGTLHQSGQADPPFRLKGKDVAEDLRNAEEKKIENEAKTSLSTGGFERKLTSPPSLSFQLLAFLMLSSMILLATSTLAAPVTGGEKEKEEQRQKPPKEEEGTGGSFLRSEILLGSLPRSSLVRLRRRSGGGDSRRGPFEAQVDFQRRSDGSLHVVAGRAWKRRNEGAWADSDSCIKFDYLGSTFRIYIPKNVEERLTNAGLLQDFIEALSQPPRRVVVDTSGRLKTEEFHWGPEEYEGLFGFSRFKQKMRHSLRLHLHPSFDPILTEFFAEVEGLFVIIHQVRDVFAEMWAQGQNFSPRLLEVEYVPRGEL